MKNNQELTSNNTPLKNKRKKKLYWVIGGASFLLLIAAIWFFNLFGSHAYYVYVFKTEDIPEGANLYVSQRIINEHIENSTLLALKMIRPMSIREVEENVLYSEAEKTRALRIASDPSLKPYLIVSMYTVFEIWHMQKDHNFTLGKYSATLMLPMVYLNTHRRLVTVYEIEPNEKYFQDGGISSEIPIGYVLANKLAYIDPPAAHSTPPVVQ